MNESINLAIQNHTYSFYRLWNVRFGIIKFDIYTWCTSMISRNVLPSTNLTTLIRLSNSLPFEFTTSPPTSNTFSLIVSFLSSTKLESSPMQSIIIIVVHICAYLNFWIYVALKYLLLRNNFAIVLSSLGRLTFRYRTGYIEGNIKPWYRRIGG